MARRTRVLAIGALVLLALVEPRAASAADTVLSLNTAVAAAFRHNPAFLAAQNRVQAVRGLVRQAGLYPNPRVTTDGGTGSAFGDPGDYELHVLISQAVPFGPRVRLRVRAAEARVGLVEDQLRVQAWRLKARVGREYNRLVVAQTAILAIGRYVHADRAFARLARARYHAAQVSILDVDAASYALSAARLARARWRMRQERAQRRLAQTLGEVPASPWIVEVPRLPGLRKISWQHVLRERPDIVAARQRIAYAHALARWQHARILGPLTVGAGIGVSHAVITSVPSQPVNHSVLLEFKMPLPLWNRHQGDRAAARARLAEARGTSEALLWRARRMLDRDRRALRFWQQRLGRYRRLQSRAQRDVAVALRGYGLGQVSTTTVLALLQAREQLGAHYIQTWSHYLAARWALVIATQGSPGEMP